MSITFFKFAKRTLVRNHGRAFAIGRLLGGFYVNGDYYRIYKCDDGFRLRGSSVSIAINFLVDAYAG